MKLYNGACEEILKTLPDNSVDAVICDPPYGILKTKRKDFIRKMEWDVILNYAEILPSLKRICKQNSLLLIFYDFDNKFDIIDDFATHHVKLHNELIWHKPDYNHPYVVQYKPVKDVESILLFQLNAKKPTYYPCMTDIAQPDVCLKYAIWCESATSIGNDPYEVNYDEALKKVLENDEEFLNHIRFTSTIPKKSLTFANNGPGSSLAFTLKRLNEGSAYIKDGRIYTKGKERKCLKVSSVFSYPTGRHLLHPTQKPIELMKKLVSLYTKERRHSA